MVLVGVSQAAVVVAEAVEAGKIAMYVPLRLASGLFGLVSI